MMVCHLEVGPVHLALETGDSFKADVGLAPAFLFYLADMELDGIVAACIPKLPDPFVDPGGAVIVLLQEVVNGLVVRGKNAFPALAAVVLGRLSP